MSDSVSPIAGKADGGPRRAARRAAAERAATVDVWSRTEPKYRIRATLLLVTNFVLFCGLCVFTHWLHKARPFDFSAAGYVAPTRFWDSSAPSLNDFVLNPISVAQTPVHGIVLGLLVASIVAVPIVVAILYRWHFALPFVAAVAVLAHMPWMGFTLLISCTLAAVRPFRMSFRFSSALVGMLPVLLYLLLATRGSPHAFGSSSSPTQRLLLAYPWVLAILAACLMMAAMLGIARFVDYRPGPVAPVIAFMFAMPLTFFHASVGVDELAYRVLEGEFGPRSARFVPVKDVAAHLQQLAAARPRELLAALRDPRAARQRIDAVIVGHFTCEFLADRRDAYDACRNFIAAHPESRYVPCAYYIQGRVLDTRIDERKLTDSFQLEPTGEFRRELYTDFPHVQSEETWSTLLTRFPDSELSIVAGLRLAQLRLRRGDADGALSALTAAEAAVARDPAAASQPSQRPLFRTAAPTESLDFEPGPYLLQVRRLRELIEANAADPRYGTAPLRQFARLDPRRAAYDQRLLRVAEQFPGALLYDNLLVRHAATCEDPADRAARLEACLRAFPDGDAVAEATFRLADLEILSFGGQDEARRAAGIARLRELATRRPATSWGDAAAQRLRLLEESKPAAAEKRAES